MALNPNLQAYFQLRENFIFWGKYYSFFLLLAGLSLLFLPLIRFRQRLFFWLSFLILSAGFLSLIWYHFQISQILVLQLPDQSSVRFHLPFWIEGEKLFFWSYVFSLLLVFKPNKKIENWLYFGLGILILFSLLFEHTFLNPLPSFHREVFELWQALKTITTSQASELLFQFGLRAKYFYNSSYMWTHPPLIFFSYAAFTYSFIAGLYLLFKSDSEVEKSAHLLIKIGYFALSAGLLLGFPWAITAWKNEPWWWSPKINVSLMMWLFYTSYLHLRLYPYRKNKPDWPTYLNLLSFISLLFTYLTTYLIPGVHSYA